MSRSPCGRGTRHEPPHDRSGGGSHRGARHGGDPMTAAGMPVLFRAPLQPWAIAPDDERRFRRIAKAVLLTCGVIFAAIPWLPVHGPDRSAPAPLAAPLARRLREREAPKGPQRVAK